MKKIITLLLAFICLTIDAQTGGSTSGWLLNGNGNTGNLSYLGTSGNRSLVLKSNGSSRAKFDSIGNIYLNAATSREFFVQTNGTNRFRVNTSYGAIGLPFRVGSTSAPSATLDVTGTMSVSSTATLTGAAKQTNTLNYEGNTTWNTNQTNTLTTGNTGTIAVLSDAVFPVSFAGTSYNPSDGSTVYLGNHLVVSGASATGTITIPYNCTLVSWNYNNYVSGTLASAENSTASISGTTNYTLTSTATYTALNSNFSGSGLSQNFSAGDVINLKIVHPTYVTNPTTLYHGITLWFVRRQ